MKIVEPSVELLRITEDGARAIEEAGRTCYKSEDKSTDDSAYRFVRMLSDRGHQAMLEFGYASFRVVTDRGISHEIVRHRLFSYAQESTRYCNYSKDKFDKEISVVLPSNIRSTDRDGSYELWKQACELTQKHYFLLLQSGCSPQVARSVLPTCLKTEIVMQANFREWLHFLYLRHSPHAHPDMQLVAAQIGAILKKECPAVFEDYPQKGI